MLKIFKKKKKDSLICLQIILIEHCFPWQNKIESEFNAYLRHTLSTTQDNI